MAGKSLPRQGLVSQLRQNWSVYEDEALANKIQHEEINHHYQGNKSRNQQIRADLPQAKQIQDQEIKGAQRQIKDYRRQLDEQARLDEKVALQLALSNHSGFRQPDDEYTRKRDEMFARNIQDLENRYRSQSRQSNGEGSGGVGGGRVQYNDSEYRIKVARPAYVTDEPVYANQEEERFMRSIQDEEEEDQPGTGEHRPLKRSSHEQPGAYAMHSTNSYKATAASSNSYNTESSKNSNYKAASSNSYSKRRPVEDLNTSSEYDPSSRASERSGSSLTSYSEQGTSEARGYSADSASGYTTEGAGGYSAAGASEYASEGASGYFAEGASGSSAKGASGYSTEGASGYSAKGASGYPTNSSSGYSPEGASGYSTHHAAEASSGHIAGGASGFSPQGASGYTADGAYGYTGGASGYDAKNGRKTGLEVDTDDVLGLRSALSPEEIAAAEAAEALLDQERRDAELALRLQEQLELTEGGDNDDRRVALEAQDREYARALQAKEKARVRRAKEKARQRKLEKQRQEATSRIEAEVNQEDDGRDGVHSRLSPREQQMHSLEQQITPREQQLSPREQQKSPRDQYGSTTEQHISNKEQQVENRLSPRSPDVKPPARKPYVHTAAIDSHTNDTYCKTQITPTQSISSESSEPQYANLDQRGQPLKTEPILHLPVSSSGDKISPRQSAMNEDMPIPPYMPMQSCASRKSESMERKIKKKKEKEGCKQQ